MMGGGESGLGDLVEVWRSDGGWRGGGGVGIGTCFAFVVFVLLLEMLGRTPLGPCLWP